MRPIADRFPSSQEFASMPTAGVRGNINAPSTTPEYWVGRYGNYQPYGHAGWDGKCPVGTEVRAMSGGTVLWADWGYNLPGTGPVRKWLFYATFPGKLLVIQHWWGIGAYAHLSAFRVKAGDAVTEGQVVALSGDTGGVDPHLHVEALVDLSYRTGGGLIYGRTDPAKYFGTINPSGETEEDTLSEKEVQEIKDFTFVTLNTMLDQFHTATRRNIIEELSAKMEDSEYDVKRFLQDDGEKRHVVTREQVDAAFKAHQEATR